MNHLDNHNLLYPLQHGFRSKLSCETQLLTFTQEIFDSMASGKQTDVAIMDFSKAFDKVDHQRLILKLKRMGINNKTSNLIGAWLSHRFQRVVVNSHTSNSCPVLSGIPQGSVLGTCLFPIYINDTWLQFKNVGITYFYGPKPPLVKVPCCDARYDFRVKRCSIRLDFHLFFREFMFYYCYLYCFTYTGGKNTIYMPNDVPVFQY